MATGSCIDEIENFISAKISFEFANHEKAEHGIRQEHISELGRDVQTTRNELHQCIRELAKNRSL